MGVGYVHYLDHSGFMIVLMSKLIEFFTLGMCSLLYVNYTLYNAVKNNVWLHSRIPLNLKLWKRGLATHF